ncbi:FecR family protein [Natronoflexus pectinivorans]|uniref:FecR family protein n=1 Tax=Natronoflexus pectinivorans TaxID=682526 RepID=A0A4R2GN73_9BACT|nr:FecR domain-containing protein [Natronoflexus pectinivorans]TCO09889.1 FecR family protein [Natronoflexus pectinivorans]
MKLSDNINYNQLCRVLSGEATSKDMAFLETWLRSDERNHEIWNELRESWMLAGTASQCDQINTDSAWQQVSARMKSKPTSKNRLIPIYQYAAAIVAAIVLIGGLLYFLLPTFYQQADQVAYITYSDSSEIILPDGTLVALNSGSSISYPENFGATERRVLLSGEAWFEVTSDQQNTFIVETRSFEVKVLGTSFNVRSYEHLELCQIDVNKGVVEVVSFLSDLDPLKLAAGDGADFYVPSGTMIKRSLYPNNLAWKTGELRFHDVSLYEVFNTLEQTYHIRIVTEDPSILDEKLVASFSQNTFDYIMDVVCLTFNLTQVKSDEFVLVKRLNAD